VAEVLACVNLKGGVGKTTLAVNLAAFAGREGMKALLVDVDPQTNATFSWMSYKHWHEHARTKGTLASLMLPQATRDVSDAHEVFVHDVSLGVDLLPSHLDLFTLDLVLGPVTARELLLKKALSGVVREYDLVVCDCPPNLTMATQNALAFSTHYVVPISPDYLSALGVGLLINRVNDISAALQRELELVGILFSRVGRRAAFRDRIMAGIRQEFGDLVFQPQLKERAAVSEAQELHQSVFEMGNSRASKEFRDVCSEILQRMGF
jgi:chromosome partitioning protein